MTVAALTSKVDYIENGVTLPFAVPFRFLAGALAVTRVLIDGTVQSLALGVDYSTTGGSTDAGGTLTLVGTVAGAKLRIRRSTPRQQQAAYTDADRFPAASHEGALDRAMMIDQEQDDRIADTAARALLVPDGETAPSLPARSARASRFLAFDAEGNIIPSNGVGVDAGLRLDLAALAVGLGASLIGNLGGGTVQDAVFVKGPAAAVIATTAKIDWKREGSAPAYPVASMGGLWPTDKVHWDHAISAEFDAVNTPVTLPLVSPASTILLAAHNKGTGAIVVPLQTIVGVHVNGKEAAGPNFISYSSPGTLNAKIKGVEIDIQPGAGTTISECFGLALNAFGQDVLGDAIFIEGVFGGRWGSGIRIGALNPSIGAGIYGAGSMGALLDTASGVYGMDAILLSNTHAIQFRGATGRARLYVDAGNVFHAAIPAAGWVFRDTGDTTSLISIDPGGNLNLEAGGVLRVSNTQVLSTRRTGWAAATGTATRSTFATGSVTLPVLAEHVKALIDDFMGHGAIGA